jgi:phosphatidylglycerophosphatase A
MSEASLNTTARSPSDRLLHFVGTLAYLGYVPIASGTVAVAVVGLPSYFLLVSILKLGWESFLACCVALSMLAVWVAGRTDRVLGEQDSKKNVIDEIPGFWIAMIGLPLTWQVVAAAFFVERSIDIVKVWPANWVEKKLPGGWGVVLDDVVAGVYTLGILHVAVRFFPIPFGITS